MSQDSDALAYNLHRFINDRVDDLEHQTTAVIGHMTRTGIPAQVIASTPSIQQAHRRIVALRRLLRLHQPILLPTVGDVHDDQPPPHLLGCATCRDADGTPFDAPCWTLRLLAQEWADTPSYDTRWRLA